MKRWSSVTMGASLALAVACGKASDSQRNGDDHTGGRSGDGDGDGDTGGRSGDGDGDGDTGGRSGDGDGDGDTGGRSGDGDGDGDTGGMSTGGTGTGGIVPGDGDGDLLGGAGGVGNPEDCSFSISHQLSPWMGSVGIVEFDTPFDFESASIRFGRTNAYGMLAPVDAEAPNLRTLLLGMTFDAEYHYQIVLERGEQTCVSEDRTIATGDRPVVPPIAPGSVAQVAPADFAVTDTQRSTVHPGYLLVSHTGSAPSGRWATIYNTRGELVWARLTGVSPYSYGGGLKMSLDSEFLLSASVNPSLDEGYVERISLEGDAESLVVHASAHDDLAPTPDGGFFYIAADDDSLCDVIYKYPENTVFYQLEDAFPLSDGANTGCLATRIDFNEFDESVSVSVHTVEPYGNASGAVVTVDKHGQLQWVLGSSDSSFDVGGRSLLGATGFHLTSPTALALFAAGDQSGNSLVYGVELNLVGGTADFVRTYQGDHMSFFLGDVQRLPGGNWLITHGDELLGQGLIYEVTATNGVVWKLVHEDYIGFVNYQPDLYAPPLR